MSGILGVFGVDREDSQGWVSRGYKKVEERAAECGILWNWVFLAGCGDVEASPSSSSSVCCSEWMCYSAGGKPEEQAEDSSGGDVACLKEQAGACSCDPRLTKFCA